jgi:dienelactone hydrolase
MLKKIAILAALVLLPMQHLAAQPLNEVAIPTPVDPTEIALYGDATPGSRDTERWTTSQIGLGIQNVSRPTLLPMLPRRGKANGTAIVVAPGGGFIGLAWEHEGLKVGRALTAKGFTVFVLKYRLRPTTADPASVGAVFGPLIKRAMDHPDEVMETAYAPALDDGRAAVAWVRSRAAQYGIDPHRVGMIGFSAGAMTTIAAALNGNSDQMPDFAGYIYGPQFTVTVPANAPPLFAAWAIDDPLFKTRGIPLIEAWQRARRPAEVHIYGKGSHGFGLGRAGETDMLMLDQFVAWIAMNGFTKAKP